MQYQYGAGLDGFVPAYLVYPNDPFSGKMFRGKMSEAISLSCGYRFMICRETANCTPVIQYLLPRLDCNEIHYYCKEDAPAWYSVSIMKHESVCWHSVREWVETTDMMLLEAGCAEEVLRIPEHLRGRRFIGAAMYDLGQCPAYNRTHMLDETHVYAHVFYLDDQLFKKFILLARRKDWAWRLEVTVPSNHEGIMQEDFVPPGQTFGKFYVSV